MVKLSRFSPLALLLTLGWHPAFAGNPFCTDIPPPPQPSSPGDEALGWRGGACSINVMTDSVRLSTSAAADMSVVEKDRYQGVLMFEFHNPGLLGTSRAVENTAKILELGFATPASSKGPKGFRLDVTLTQRADNRAKLAFDYLDGKALADSTAINPELRGSELQDLAAQSLIDSQSCGMNSTAATIVIDRTRAKRMMIDVIDSNSTTVCSFPLGPEITFEVAPPLMRWGVLSRLQALPQMSFQARWGLPELNCEYPDENCGQRY